MTYDIKQHSLAELNNEFWAIKKPAIAGFQENVNLTL